MKPTAPCQTAICAIIVSYHPDADFPARVSALACQVGAVIVVDNASGNTCTAMLAKLAQHDMLTLIVNPDNYGIARALNIGIQYAAEEGYSWALLFDQDTCVDEHLVATLISVYAAFPEKSRLAVIGTHFHDRHRPPVDSAMQATATSQWHEVDWVITSGSLISIPVYTKVGPFREDFFIDFVDTEYCIRARKAGFIIIKTTAALMLHAIGASTRHQIWGMLKWTSNHSADRRYYITRNYTVLLRESGKHRFGGWAIKGGAASFKSIKRILLYEQNKKAKLIAVFQGWRDAIRGRMGQRGHVVK
ncbi:MAG: glycosyltransferase family 2 protein [Sulfuriferula sp.]